MKIIYLCYSLLLLYAAYMDYKKLEIRDSVNIGILALSLFHMNQFHFYILGAFLIALPFLYLGIKTNGIGGGDIKFVFANGCFLGFGANYMGILIGFLFVMIATIIKKILGMYQKGRKIPLAPYLVSGYLVIIVDRFLGLF